MKKSVLKYFPKLDTTVFLTFGGILLLGLIILIYQLNHRTDCTEAKYIIHTDDFITKNLIEFIDNTKGATSWKWDFGDGSAVDYNQNALHSYNKAGQYIVTLTINNTCSFQNIVTITDPDADSGYLPVIIAPKPLRGIPSSLTPAKKVAFLLSGALARVLVLMPLVKKLLIALKPLAKRPFP